MGELPVQGTLFALIFHAAASSAWLTGEAASHIGTTMTTPHLALIQSPVARFINGPGRLVNLATPRRHGRDTRGDAMLPSHTNAGARSPRRDDALDKSD